MILERNYNWCILWQQRTITNICNLEYSMPFQHVLTPTLWNVSWTMKEWGSALVTNFQSWFVYESPEDLKLTTEATWTFVVLPHIVCLACENHNFPCDNYVLNSMLTNNNLQTWLLIGWSQISPAIWFKCCTAVGVMAYVIVWERFPHYWPFVNGIRSPLVPLLLTWTRCRINGRVAGDLRHHDAHVTPLNWLSRNPCCLTHWGRDKMAAIFQTTFSNAFSWMKMFKLRLRFHWSLFQGSNQ